MGGKIVKIPLKIMYYYDKILRKKEHHGEGKSNMKYLFNVQYRGKNHQQINTINNWEN